MAARDDTPDPTVEIGNAGTGIAGWDAFRDASENVPKLAFPASVRVYDEMRNDEQIAALFLSFMLPIMGYRWYIDANGARDEVVEHVAGDFGLPIDGQDAPLQGRMSDRFSHSDYLRHSLLKLIYGFMFFEQVYRLGDDEKLHIRKLAPRMPGSIQQVQAAPDGGLQYIRQYPAVSGLDPLDPFNRPQPTSLYGNSLLSPVIPVGRLIAHVNDKEGGNWYGRPWTRALYRMWMLKDNALRVDAMKNERNGMGVPTIEAPPNASKGLMAKLANLAMAYKAGKASGGSLPNGSNLKLNGVSGTLPIVLDSVKYYDEQMARRFLAMFTQLGTTATGSRALGNTFVDFFGLAQEAVAKEYADTTNAHAVEDLVDLNYPIGESAPLLKFRAESDRALATADLVALIESGGITMSDDDERWLRAEHDMPDLVGKRPPVIQPPTTPPPVTPPDPGAAAQQRARHQHDVRNAASQREPSEVEMKSKVDFAALQKAYKDALTALLDEWKTNVKTPQITELVATIAATSADDLAALAALQAAPKGADILTTSAQALASVAAEQAIQEITDQGVTIDAPDLTALNTVLANRADAIEVLMANSISQAASNHAVSQAGEGASPTEIAMSTGDHLNGLSDAYLNEQLGGALTGAQNAARFEVFDVVPDKEIYSSEILDTHTCAPCREIDGTKYDSIDAARADYGPEGYRECEGGGLCRGTAVAVAGTESQPSVQ